MTPPLFPPMLQSYDQITSTLQTHIPSSVGAGLNIGVPGVPLPAGTSSTMGVPRASPNVTPLSLPVPNGPFLALGNPYTNYLPSSAILTHQLRNVDDAIAQQHNLLHKDSAGTLSNPGEGGYLWKGSVGSMHGYWERRNTCLTCSGNEPPEEKNI